MPEFYIQKNSMKQGCGAVVQDENSKNTYFLVGKIGSNGDTLALYNLLGEHLAKIQQTSAVFGANFDLFIGEEKFARMIKIMNWRKTMYFIPKLKWLIHGDLTTHIYTISDGLREVMSMKPVSTSFGDVFSIIIKVDSEVNICLCIASVLDYWSYNRENQAALNSMFSIRGI